VLDNVDSSADYLGGLIIENAAAPTPTIHTQPTNQTVLIGDAASFSVSASGAAPLSYFWRRNGAPIAGANSSSYTNTNVQFADSGSQFSCLVSNGYGTVLSSNATLTVRSGVAILPLVRGVGDQILLSFSTQLGWTYILEFKNSLSDPVWTPLRTNDGNGSLQTVILSPQPGAPQRFYHLRLP